MSKEYYKKNRQRELTKQKAYYYDNKDQRHAYYENNKERIKKYNAQYNLLNKEDNKNYDRLYKKKHAEELRLKRKIHNAANRERIKEYNKQYKQKNKEKLLAYAKEHPELIRQPWRCTASYWSWQEAVYKRDNHTCRHCGKMHCLINAHHIKHAKDHIDLRYDINNGITLCTECHKKEHSIRNQEPPTVT